MILALALWIKVSATVLLVIAGFFITCAIAMFGSDADPETGETSSDWIFSAVIFVLAICGIWFLSSCTIVSANRTFPKLAPYWSAEAKQQRAYDRHVETGEDGP